MYYESVTLLKNTAGLGMEHPYTEIVIWNQTRAIQLAMTKSTGAMRRAAQLALQKRNLSHLSKRGASGHWGGGGQDSSENKSEDLVVRCPWDREKLHNGPEALLGLWDGAIGALGESVIPHLHPAMFTVQRTQEDVLLASVAFRPWCKVGLKPPLNAKQRRELERKRRLEAAGLTRNRTQEKKKPGSSRKKKKRAKYIYPPSYGLFPPGTRTKRK
ncbi:hypothetical protein CBR_g32279 [Chara braunii]|uniref:Uncharacterized protein n=1 Tax=Chara braunii TaxID=69332 RepID=A0A388JN85_CHABU|nr:hypothetical protein CBR_g32279 [Chara braunii]|eukprot:GBG59264.1 hypothetical protein CBR_g32279 [Chara braunii]